MKVLELYSGIGGMHYALKESGIEKSVVAAVDINTVANEVYSHNFPDTKLLQRNIESFTAKEINDMEVEMITMSPPCQPFTRVGLQKDTKDDRSKSFMHILKILPELNKGVKYIVIENVKGFEVSETRGHLVLALKRANFIWQEFIVCPSQFMIPNTRHRYYLIAKRTPLKFVFPTEAKPMLKLPYPEHCTTHQLVKELYTKLMSHYQPMNPKKGEDSCRQLKAELGLATTDIGDGYLLPDNVLGKRAWLLDIVMPESRRSCCFTKAYGHYTEGTGSVISNETPSKIAEVFEKSKELEEDNPERLELLKSLKLRYFTPREVATLMQFRAESFGFPENVTTKQKYRLLGNSVNVFVVSRLMILLVAGDEYKDPV